MASRLAGEMAGAGFDGILDSRVWEPRLAPELAWAYKEAKRGS